MIKNRNMLSKTNGSITTIQEYDLINRMVSYTNGTVTAKYSYYLNDMRKSKEIDGITTTHIWFGSNIVIDITESNYVKYVHGYNLINSDYGWYHYNAHGDVVQLTDNNSTVIADYDYDPFGIHMKEAEQDDLNPFRYCGEYYDLESGYVYLRARYYDPEIGRFISEDPARDGFNWFVYCNNNPIRYIDPSGMFPIVIPITIELIDILILIGTGAGAYLVGNELLDSGFKVSDLFGNATSGSKYVVPNTAPIDPKTGKQLSPAPAPIQPKSKTSKDSYGAIRPKDVLLGNC